MKYRYFCEVFKNAAGTVFLLAAAFFVSSTILSMRAVFADPIAPVQSVVTSQQSTRSSARSSRTTRNNSRSTNNTASSGKVVDASTATTTRATAGKTVVSRSGQSGSKNVVNRSVTARTSVQPNRTVRSRTATTGSVDASRVSLTGSAMRGNRSSTSTTYTYLSSKLYTGNYSNIVDSTTGLISADAYNNCKESYYACMDEICTARNSAQRRCACAGRVQAFAEAENKLESANEELIKVSGELALLIATKGKDVSSAFKLTDAEQIMNCVSYQEMSDKYDSDTDADEDGEDDKKEWCYSHAIYDDDCSLPSYCTEAGNTYGFDISDLNGSSSDILASLKSWADAKDKTLTITSSDDDMLSTALSTISGVVSDMSGLSDAFSDSSNLKDSLAETWGYELFEYAHNNVCNRVLDSCFNGIYEACGTPTSTGRDCSDGSSTCPYNYNSYITVTNTGTYELNFVTGNTGTTSSNTATCFGYTSTSGDPYLSLRGPVADARRSILQKYALDANADCDAYGEELERTAQNIGYQKVAAQQALQQKRLEFATEEAETILSEAVSAGTNFSECLSEIYDCYEEIADNEDTWTTARIKTYCAQISQVPSCYKDMICNPSTAQFKAIIDVADSDSCFNSQDYKTNTCRNIVTLNEILNGTGAAASPIGVDETGDSAAFRESCLEASFVDEIRDWSLSSSSEEDPIQL